MDCQVVGCRRTSKAKGYCEKHYMRLWRWGFVERLNAPGRDPIFRTHKFCALCHQEKPIKDFHPRRVSGKHGIRTELQGYCKSCRNTYKKQWTFAQRIEVFKAYGGICICCGETQQEFLSLDHINNDGSLHRRANKLTGGTSLYTWVKKHNYPASIRLLCMNCNSARGNFGYCPHERK